MKTDQAFREDVLRNCGATAAEVDELLGYTENVFDHGQAYVPYPLEDEPFAKTWAYYAAEAEQGGVFQVLKEKLIQLQFPIQDGISQSTDYQLATRRGYLTEGGCPGLSLERPDALRLLLYPTPAGRVPVLIATHRPDFIRLVQALTRHNEPQVIPASMGACMVTGYNNWARIRAIKLQWKARHPHATEGDWNQEFRRIIPQKALYQDRFILLSDGPYSAVSADALGLTDASWRATSLKIRLEHECTHYFTRRVLGAMQNALFDELLADYMGLVVACGRFRASWLLRFMGLEEYPQYRDGGRLQNYRGKPVLSQGAFRHVQTLVYRAAHHLERFDQDRTLNPGIPEERAWLLLALTRLSLAHLAADNAVALVEQSLREVKQIYQGMLVS